MSDVTRGAKGAETGTGAARGRLLGVLLVCFPGVKTVGKVRRGLDAQLKSQGDTRS